MKNWNWIPLLIVAAAMGSPALASETLVVQVPFGFTAGNTTFPSGEYVLTMDKTATGTVLFHGPKNGIVLTRRMERSEQTVQPALSFNTYGERRFLSAIHTGRKDWTLLPSAQELELAELTKKPLVTDLQASPAESR